MTITTLILLLATGILAVMAVVDNCQYTSITSCCDLQSKYYFTRTRASPGIYILKNFCGDNCTDVGAYCDTSNGGGGWLVLQRRQDGSVDFNRTWLEYEDGFGNLTGEFWYGLRALHCLTGQGGWEMRLDINLPNGTKIFLQYEQFKVASAKDKYKLTVGGFQGTTNDPMAYHHDMYFTTIDSDNDQWRGDCALDGAGELTGGWWYKQCAHVRPNAFYNYKYVVYLNGKWHGPIPFIEMKIRPHNCNI